jgi:hypothetical protein
LAAKSVLVGKNPRKEFFSFLKIRQSMNGKGWGLIGAAAALIALVSSSETVKKVVVDILKSMNRTFGNEGAWEPETARGAKLDTGNYYKGVYYGTNHGVTARFLVDNFAILQIPLIGRDTVKNLSVEQCADIFQRTEGMRMRYEDFQNQAVADFVFDWMVHRPGNTEKSGGCVYFMEAKIFGMPMGTALVSSGIFSDDLIQRINSTEPSAMYNALKYWRFWHLRNTDTYKSFQKGVYNRIAAFTDFLPTGNVVEIQKAARLRAFGY